MSIRTGRAVLVTAGIMAVIYAASVFLLCLFEGNIGGTLLYQAITSGVFCVFLIYVVFANSALTVQQPFPAYIITGFYLIDCLLMCFPNHYVEDFAITYLIAIPIAMFYGFRYSLPVITAIFLLLSFGGNGSGVYEIHHVIYAVIVCSACAGKKQKGSDLVAALTAFILQGIILLLSRNFFFADQITFVKEIIVIVLNSVTVPLVFRLSLLQESVPESVETVETEKPEVTEEAVDVIPIEAIHELSKPELEIDYSKFPFDLSYLVREDCEVAQRIKACLPRAFERATEIACFARSVAGKFDVNSDLVYTAALYHDVERIYNSAPTADVVLPEYLYQMIKRQNEKQLPTSVEELIVLLSNHLLAIHHYMEKNNSDVSITKIIENIFNLQLKKGSIMSAGISMSLYHKMKQEFTSEFIAYLNSKAL